MSVADEGEVDDDLVRDMTEVLGWFCARLYGRGGAQPGREGAAVCRTRYGTHGAVTPHCDNESMPVYQAFRFELDPSTTTRSALGSHAGASRFAYNWGLALVKDRLDARQALEVLAMRQGAGAGEARARAAETAGPVVDPLLVAQGVEPGNRRVHPLVERELQGGLQLGLRRPGPGTEGVLRFKRWRPGRQAHGVPELQEQGWPAKLPLQHRGDPGPRRPPCPVAEARRHPDQGAQRALSDQVVAGMARVLSATVKEEAGRWSVSFGCALERHDPVATYPEAIVGVDLWLHHFAVLSTGELFENPRPISQRARRMARLNRELSRAQKGSKRRARTRAKLARCHRRVANLRRDTLHKLTTHLATAYGTVVIEDLAVKNMTACPKPKADPENPGHHLDNGHAAKAGLKGPSST